MRGLRRRLPSIDIVRVQDTEIYQAKDSAVLAWAAQHGPILLTHDIETIPPIAYAHLASGLSFPGVLLIRDTLPVGDVIEDLLTIIGASDANDWKSKVEFLPL